MGKDFKYFLEEAKMNDDIVSVFSNRYDMKKCAVGFIGDVCENGVVINHVTSEGNYDGFVWRKLESIYRIDIAGKYEMQLKKLYKKKNQTHEKLCRADNKKTLEQLFEFAYHNNKVVNVCLDESEEQENIVGLIKEIDEEGMITIKRRLYGEDDGMSVFHMENTFKISCDSCDDKWMNE